MKIITELEEPNFYEVWCELKDGIELDDTSELTEETVTEVLEWLDAYGFKVVK